MILQPYLPRLVFQWLSEEPHARWREVDGSLAFVDISGFTKLTERLARLGKAGAEELDDILNRTFTDLLRVAYADGAGLIKWGGDAVLLLFQDEGHAARAARASYRMRAMLRDIGRVQTPSGAVRLRMSIGIHSGAFHFFLVGDPSIHRELVISGPGATRTAAMEVIAEAGEIAISPETARLLDPRVVGQPKADALLLAREPHVAARAAEQIIETTGLDVATCLPVAVRRHLLSGLGEAEHRPVVAAFIEFSGVDDLLAVEGVEATADAIDDVIRSAQEAALRHEVGFAETDINKDGGKVMLIAGAPDTTGVDEERMLLVARTVMDRRGRLSLRIGVNAGHVFSGDFGPPFRRTYSVKGDAINLAARLMGKAKAGQIITTPRVLDRSRVHFEMEALEPFMVKGKSRPITAFFLGARRGRAADAGTKLPLVGRDEEAARLRSAFEASRRGDGWVVELVAEPGMGKSRLIEEVRDWASHDEVVLTAACEAYESSTPYFPFRGVLRDLLGIPEGVRGEDAAERLRHRMEGNAPHLLPWLPLLGVPLDLHIPDTPETAHLEDEFRKPRMEEVLSEFLGLTLPTPTLLVIEDTHWMDDASADLLRRLIVDITGRPWMVCATRRAKGGERVALAGPRVETIELQPLPLDLSMMLLGAASDESPVSPQDMAVLAERSGGNPLFLRELLSATQAAGGIAGLPDSVEAVITAQIDRLSAHDRSLLRYVSVLGQRFSESLARSVLAGLMPGVGPEVWAPLSSFIVRESDDTLRFSHGLVRDAAYSGLPYRRRRELHGAVAATIEAAVDDPNDSAELLSYHYFLADVADMAWEYSRIAGDRAKSLYANAEAARFFQRAIESAKKLRLTGHHVADVLSALGEVRERLGRYSEAAGAYRDARKMLAGDAIAEADLMRKEAWVREAAGRFSDAVRWHLRGLALLEGIEDPAAAPVRAELLVGVAAMRHHQGRFDESIEWCQRAIEEAERAGARQVVAHAAYLLDWLYDELGRPEEAPYPGLALQLFEELDDLSGQANVLNNLGMFAYFRGEWDEAIAYYERSRRARLELGDEINGAYGTANVAEVLADQGRLEEAEARFREALRVWRASGFRQGVAFAAVNLGKIASRQGRFDEAVRLLEDAKKGFEEVGFSSYVLDAEARLAENDVFRGEAEAAIARVESVLKRADAMGGLPVLSAVLHRIRAYAKLQQGDTADAIDDATTSIRLARERNARYEVALGLEALAAVRRKVGEPADVEADRERDEILGTLGVESTPSVPLVSPTT